MCIDCDTLLNTMMYLHISLCSGVCALLLSWLLQPLCYGVQHDQGTSAAVQRAKPQSIR